MHAIVHAADVQDRDGVLLTSTLFGLYPFLRKIFADGGYQGLIFAADFIEKPIAAAGRLANISRALQRSHDTCKLQAWQRVPPSTLQV